MPPPPKKQLPRTTPSLTPTSGVFERVAPVAQVDSGGIKVSLYGKAKTGKTRLISTFPKPILIIGAEDGTRSIRNVEGVDFVLLREADEVDELASGAVARGYQTVAVDTASALQDLILAEILGLKELPVQRTWGMASRDQYGQCSMRLKTLLRKVLAVPVNVVVTAHERSFGDEGGGADQLVPSIGSALSPSAATWLNGAVEYVCQTFIRSREETKTTVIGKGTPNQKTVETKVKSDKKEYCLRVGPHEVYMTGFRLPPGVELPDAITNPSYDKIKQLIDGEPVE